MQDMQEPKASSGLVSAVSDVRHVPLSVLAAVADVHLRRIVPLADDAHVPVAAFDSAL